MRLLERELERNSEFPDKRTSAYKTAIQNILLKKAIHDYGSMTPLFDKSFNNLVANMNKEDEDQVHAELRSLMHNIDFNAPMAQMNYTKPKSAI